MQYAAEGIETSRTFIGDYTRAKRRKRRKIRHPQEGEIGVTFAAEGKKVRELAKKFTFVITQRESEKETGGPCWMFAAG